MKRKGIGYTAVVWSMVIALASIAVIVAVSNRPGYTDADRNWYLGCIDMATRKEYIVRTPAKPYIRDGFVVIGDEMFLSPIPGMTCRPINGEEIRKKTGSNVVDIEA